MSHSPFDLEAAQEQDEKRVLAKTVRVLEAENDFQWVMSTQRGRRFMYGLLSDAGIYRTSFAVEPQVTAFNEGRRDSGLRLLDKLQRWTPEQYLTMMQESICDDTSKS